MHHNLRKSVDSEALNTTSEIKNVFVMNLTSIFWYLFIFCIIPQRKCSNIMNSNEQSEKYYFLSKILDLDPRQDFEVLLNKSYTIFSELFTTCEVFDDYEKLLINNPDKFRGHKIPKNLNEVLKQNLNSKKKFLLYPDLKKPFLLKLEDFPILKEYLEDIGNLEPSESYVNSFVSLILGNTKGIFYDWHKFLHFLLDYNPVWYRENRLFTMIRGIEYDFYFQQHSYMSKYVNEPFWLEEILGKETYKQIKFYKIVDYTTPAFTSAPPTSTTEYSKKGVNFKNSRGKCFILREDQKQIILSNSTKGSNFRNVQGKCFILRPDQLEAVYSNSTQGMYVTDSRGKCLYLRLDKSQEISSAPSSSNSSTTILRSDEIRSQDIDLPPAELEVPINSEAYVCNAAGLSSSRFKRKIPKIVKNTILKIFTYNMYKRNILNKKIYYKLLNDFKYSKNETKSRTDSNFIEYIEERIKNGDSKMVNKILQNLCQDEFDSSDEYYGYIFDNDNPKSLLEEAVFFEETLNYFYENTD